ncbi:lactate dehydrogenase [Acidianus manzaensis]|uniref:Lactate dehydrogenase n=1 Tax=Acidianus manzaensis TaxID=282676 RepID=A0A1W6K0W2_9CREN|nr:Ldh family oxidoreductase [Acidianus manzaensis]ARM76191.1 lactate dehydrogenase [Acidianus manzaensis]
MNIKVDDLKNLLLELLEKRDIEGKEIIVDHFIEAELRGHSSHGVQRIIPLIKGIELNTIRRRVSYRIVKESQFSILIDANHSIGIVLWNNLISQDLPSSYVIAVRNASHIGFLGYYTRRLANAGFISIMFGNAEPAVVMPGKNTKILSTTPLSIGIPSNPPVVLDMALSSTARGKIIEAQRKGVSIPYGVAVDSKGEITTDPNEALKGGILPMGGEKGFYLMITLELLTAYITGSAIGPQVKGVLNTENPSNKGEVMIIINSNLFEKNNNAILYMRNLIGSLPGDRGEKLSKRNEIEIDNSLYNMLLELNKKVPYFT